MEELVSNAIHRASGHVVACDKTEVGRTNVAVMSAKKKVNFIVTRFLVALLARCPE